MQRYLIVHGWQGNEPSHWQTWLAHRLSAAGDHVQYPELPSFDEPDLGEWLAVLVAELSHLHAAPGRTIVVCHSLGSILWLHHAIRTNPQPVDRVILVAPPGPDCGVPEVEAFFPVQMDGQAIRAAARETLLVCADNDPWCEGGAAAVFGAPLDLDSVVIRGGAHLNVVAGYGPWPEMETLARGDRFSVEKGEG